MIFSDIISVKNSDKRNSFFGQFSWTNPFGHVHFLALLKLEFFGLKMIVFFHKYRKTIFSDMSSVKNADKRKFDFSTKSIG